ncbi:MAG: glycosyltransferase family 39 protein [Methanobacterium sp.]|nr:glycosyltransferase family 39 protein [Methanobacterium sp.]
MAKFLYDWDSVGFALAFKNYNIALHQPHPPGYILYVAIGKSVNYFFNDPNFSMIFINIILSVLTVILIYFLAKNMFSRNVALIASFIFVFNPFFWFYGEIASVYLSGAFFATLIAYTSYLVLQGNTKLIYLSAAFLGIAGGFRQELIFFMFPLWLFCIFYKIRDYKKIIAAFLMLIASVMVWFIPTIYLAGGYESYSIHSQTLLFTCFSNFSVFFGGSINSHLMMDSLVITWSILGMGIISSFILILYLFLNLKKIFKLDFIKKTKVIFLILWIIPAILFNLLIYIAKPGYILIYLPAFVLIVAYVISKFSINLNKIFKKIPKKYFALILVFICILSGIIQFTNPSQGTQSGIVDYGVIKTSDNDMEIINYAVENFSSNETLLFFSSENNWRRSIYYHPDYESYSYYSRLKAGKNYYGLRHYKNNLNSVSEAEIFYVDLDSNKKVVWLINNPDFLSQIKTEIGLNKMELPDGSMIYYSELNLQKKFQIYNFAFKIG